VVVEQDVFLTGGDRPIKVPGLLVLRIRYGEIIHTRDYLDTNAIAQAGAATSG